MCRESENHFDLNEIANAKTATDNDRSEMSERTFSFLFISRTIFVNRETAFLTVAVFIFFTLDYWCARRCKATLACSVIIHVYCDEEEKNTQN